jgi:hypothetical protein
VWLAAS